MIREQRARLLPFLAWAALVLLSLRPVAMVELWIDRALSPVAMLARLASPLVWARRSGLAQGDALLAASAPAEDRNRRSLLAQLATSAEPPSELLVGCRVVPATVVAKSLLSRDRVRVRVPVGVPVLAGAPVVQGDAYVGRVARSQLSGSGELLIELVTGRDFHVGALRADGAPGGGPVRMTVGGIDPSSTGVDQALLLAAHNPSDREVLPGAVIVSELAVGEGQEQALDRLADGFRLGELRAVEGGFALAPLVDYRDGLSQLSILLPADSAAGTALPPEALDDGLWRRLSPISSGDPAPWRETLVIPVGERAGVRSGAALVSRARLLGRVTRVRLLDAQVALLGDPGLSLVAVARFEGVPEPRALGRLISLGRTNAGGVRFEWRPAGPLVLEGVPQGLLRAELFTGAGEPGLAPGLYLGEALVPVDGSAGLRELVLDDGPGGLGLSELWVRLVEPEVGS